MTTLDENIREQLSAWMDGELPADEARFLERRLANEPALRAHWQRLQLASSCMKGQALRPMPASLAERVSLAIAGPDAAVAARRPWLGWTVAASVAILAIVLVPTWGGDANELDAPIATQSTTPVDGDAMPDPLLVPMPTSADVVASEDGVPDAADPGQPLPPASSRMPSGTPVVAAAGAASGQSPSDFPLVVPNGSQNWPRSPLSAGGNDPALEAYLIRHNQMMGNDGLSGFVPYVDVVANDPQANAEANAEGEANR